MSTPIRTEIQSFLDRFFAAPNLLKPDSKPEIQRWIDRLTLPETLPTVLPCWREGRVVDWYALAFDARQLRTLGESLTAFVGPTYTTFRGQLARLDPSDPIEQAVADLTAGNAYHFRGADPAEIWKALERMRKVWECRTNRERASPASVGHVLRDFYMAIQAGDQAGAAERLTHLHEHYHLDGVNLLYLRVQLLAAFHRWADLLSLTELPDLLRLRRPSAVTEALLRGVYHRHLVRFEETLDAPGAAASFLSDVLPRFAPLFSTRAGMRSGEAIKTFMLLAATKTPPELGLCQELLALSSPSPQDIAYLTALSALAGPTVPPELSGDPLTRASEAAHASDFDRAFELAKSADSSPARTRILCECAFELGTLEARAAAVDAVNALNEAERGEFLARRVNQQLWESLQIGSAASGTDSVTAPAEVPPTDWISWLDHLDRTEGRKGSREFARQGATEWSVSGFLSASGAVSRFAEQLSSARSQTAERALRDSLPHLVEFFMRDSGWPNPILKGVYRPLVDLLFFSTDGGRADLVVFDEFLEAFLSLGITKAEYSELLSYASDLWSRFAAPNTLVWAVDTLALLAAFPCAEPVARQVFLQAVLDRAAGFSRQVVPEDQELLRLVASDLGSENLAVNYFPRSAQADATVTDIFSPLRTMFVVAYTLTERAGNQFQAVLESLAPGVRVSLAHDKYASQRLKQLAQQADIFVMVWASATHAATDCIQANRSEGKALLRPSGTGAASMLRAIRNHLTA